MDEREFKLCVLRWLLANLADGEAIASEIQYAKGMNRADLVLSSKCRLCAYEIKSLRDDFRRLAGQLTAYSEFFLETNIVVPKTAISAARELLPRSVGILSVDDSGHVLRSRAPRARTRLSRQASTSWLSSRRLHQIEKLGRPIEVMSELELTRYAIESAHGRIQPKFDAFLRERGQVLNSDDVVVLSTPTRIR